MKDARVQSAITNWAPRFVANGIDLNDFRNVTDQIEIWEQWFDVWYAMGLKHEELAKTAIGWTRAAACIPSMRCRMRRCWRPGRY